MIFAALIAGALVVGGTDGFASSSSFSGGNMLRHAPRSSQAFSMVSTPPTPSTTSTSSAPLTQDQFNAYVQNTYGRYPLTIVRGEGCKLFDSDGKEYLDFVAGISTCALGHADPDLAAAVGDQMKKFHHVSNLYYIPEQGQLAKWLVDNSCADRVFFCNSGAEANEAGIKLARKHASTKLGIAEPVIVTAKKSFHGRTLATMTATGQPNYQKNFGPLVPGFEYATYNDPEDLKRVVKRINRRGKIRSLFGRPRRAVAAIMMEALQGEGGVVPATPEFFSTVRELCDETGALMIVDEVQTGMGRTGKVWGYQNFDVEPDVVTCAKALGGGVPIGAMLCKEGADVFEPGNHASTFGGNPLACAAANCVTSKLSENGGALLENVRERGEQLRAGLAELQEKYPETVAGVRGWGLINGLVLKEESPVLAGAVVAETTKLGLLLVPAGLKVVRFVPPLVATAAEVSTALSVIDQALAIATGANSLTMKDALPQQQVLRNESHEHVPSVEEELDEYMMLREVSGQYPREDEARSYIVKRRQRGLLLSFTAMVFVSLANKVFQKLETIPMYNYPNFLNLFTTFVYIPFSFAYIIPMMRYGDTITPEQTSVPKRVFAVMGALDGVSGIMQIFASTYLGGSLIILLTQAAIPISMVTSKRLTGARYSVSQYTGATVVAAGIVIAIGPSLAVGSNSGGAQELVWSMVLVASCLPMALSSVYKEIALGESELDPIYLNGWVAVFQFLVCIPLAVPAALAGDPAISPLELPKNLWDGWMCYLGYNSVMIGEHPDNCWPDSPLYVTLYLMVNITYNVLITLILKYGGANVLFLAMTICVPLGNVIFALPFVPGHQPLHATDILGLIFVMTGLVLYRFGPALHNFFGRIEAGSDRVAKVASSIRGRGSGPSYAAGDHREPLLDLAEEGDQEDRGFYDRRRMEARRGAQGRRDHTKKIPKPIDDEWEM